MLFERFFGPKEPDHRRAVWIMAERNMEVSGGVKLLDDLRKKLANCGLSCSDVEESTSVGNPFEKKARLYWGLKQECSPEEGQGWKSRGVEIAVSHRSEVAVRCTHQGGWVDIEKIEESKAFWERRNRWVLGEWMGQEIPQPSLTWKVMVAAEIAEYIKDRRLERRSNGIPILVRGWKKASV